MNKVTEFLKSTAVGGLFVLMPLLLFYLMVTEMLDIIVMIATPIADILPENLVRKPKYPVLLGLFLILAGSFLIGFILRLEIGRRLGSWCSMNICDNLPLYKTLNNIAAGFGSSKEGDVTKPALLVSTDNTREFVYIIEDHGNSYVTVLIPMAPTPFAGKVKIVEKGKLEPLDANMNQVIMVLSHWGSGAKELLQNKDLDSSSRG